MNESDGNNDRDDNGTKLLITVMPPRCLLRQAEAAARLGRRPPEGWGRCGNNENDNYEVGGSDNDGNNGYKE